MQDRPLVATDLIERRRKTTAIADKIDKEIDNSPRDYARAILDAIGRKSFELSNNSEANPKEVKYWVDMYKGLEHQNLRRRLLQLKERRFKLLQKQADEARVTAQDSKLTDAEKAQRMRQIFKVWINDPVETKTLHTNGRGRKNGIRKTLEEAREKARIFDEGSPKPQTAFKTNGQNGTPAS